MRAGNLRRKIIIQNKTVVKDGFGGEDITWVTKKTTRASVKTLSGKDGFVADQFFGKDIREFKLRYTDVSYTDRIVYDGDNYDIIPPIIFPRDIKKEMIIKAERKSN